MRYGYIRSWHVIKFTSRGGRVMTRCGRTLPEGADERDTLPAGPSCESCLRLVERDRAGGTS